MIPFAQAALASEFTPTRDPKSGQDNPRRQELAGILGVVLYPDGWIREFRTGAIAKSDLAAGPARVEPGFQAAARAEQDLGPATLVLSGDVKSYLQAVGGPDTDADLGLLGEFGAGLKFPLTTGLAVRVGVDAIVFRGKTRETASFGSSVMPSIGLSYGATWKPQFGIAF